MLDRSASFHNLAHNYLFAIAPACKESCSNSYQKFAFWEPGLTWSNSEISASETKMKVVDYSWYPYPDEVQKLLVMGPLYLMHSPDIFIPEQQQFTIRSGVLTSISSKHGSDYRGRPWLQARMNRLWTRSLQLYWATVVLSCLVNIAAYVIVMPLPSANWPSQLLCHRRPWVAVISRNSSSSSSSF